jgi:hypothetical protein
MNYPLSYVPDDASFTGISLQLLVNRLVSSSFDTALHNKISIVNEVPGDLEMIADKQKVIPVIKELLATVFANARNSFICITADCFRDIVTLNIQDQNNNNGYALAFSIMSIEPEAVAAGGSLSIEGKQKKVATVSFSFPNCLQTEKYYS